MKQSLAEVLAGYSLVVAWFAILLFGIGSCLVPVPNPPTDPPLDPPPVEASCESACARWRELGCVEAKGSPGGISCVEVCEQVQASGVLSWDLACRSAVASCDEIDRCEE